MARALLPKVFNQEVDRALLGLFNFLPVRLAKRILWLLHQNPQLGDRWGYVIRQFHYYEPFPEPELLRSEVILQRRESRAVSWDLPAQKELLSVLTSYGNEVELISQQKQFDFHNDLYYELDAAIYYALIRHLQPKKIIEIGSGFSSQMAVLAIAQNQQGEIACIEPYPQTWLTELGNRITLRSQKLSEVPPEIFQQLQQNDILFIDSTHTVRFQSDVCKELLEIMPLLNPGVWIHWHDVFFPYDYPTRWLIEERRNWSEQYMLEAFLAFNNHFAVRLANHWSSLEFPELCAALWPGVRQWQGKTHQCGGFLCQKIA
ncbi:MAG: class I SAM-dependent methyltransferase [Oscillatoriales cyanobacterium SM2_2_1]|nr:class I SAM-dependent methyltransferase [Oscillatoriales cyanobacterium SM2_2_1]